MPSKAARPLTFTPAAMDDATAAGYLALSVADFRALELPRLPYTGMHGRHLWATATLNDWLQTQLEAAYARRPEGTATASANKPASAQ